MLELLRVSPRPVGELVRRTGLSQPGTSKHLRVLRDAGLVVSRTEGQQRIYALDVRPLVELDAWLGRPDAPLRSERQRRHAPPAVIGPQRQQRHRAVPVSQLQAADGTAEASPDGHADAHADAHAVRLAVAASDNAADDATADDATPLVATAHGRPGAERLACLVRLGHPGRARQRRRHHRRPLRLGRDGEPDPVPDVFVRGLSPR